VRVLPVKAKIIPIEDSDQVFIQKLYEEYKGLMKYAASKYTDNPADKEDIVQETVYRLMRNITVLRDIPCCNLKQYIVLTVRSVFLDMQKKRDMAMLSLDDERLEAVLRRVLLQEDGISKLSAKLDVWRLKKELPERDWVLLEGKYMRELSDERLGQIIGVSGDSVRMLLSRARKEAKDILIGSLEKGGGQFE
jgi:RNA polymerase sigma factor (sigma-70 family)